VKGIDALHNHDPQVLHRDMKSLNVMVTAQFHVKVADFGLARFNTESHAETFKKMTGTYAYSAPEMYNGQGFTAKSDVYSVGMVLWEMVRRAIKGWYQPPFEEYPNCKKAFTVLIQVAKNKLRPTIPPTTPAPMKELIEMTWNQDPTVRPLCKEFIEKLEAVEKDWHDHRDAWQKAYAREAPPTSIED